MKLLRTIFKSPRTWGLVGTAVVLYFVVFVVFGRIDMSWIMPDTNQMARSIMVAWQDLPFFAVKQKTADDGKGQYVYYTVPTKQFTTKDLAQMGVTNAVAHPAAAK